MKSPLLGLVVASLFLPIAARAQNPPRAESTPARIPVMMESRRVPYLSDLPLLGSFFQTSGARRFELEPDHEADASKLSVLGFYETWVMRELRRAVPAVTDVAIVEHSEATFTATGRKLRSKRSVEVHGPEAAATAAEAWLKTLKDQHHYMVQIAFELVEASEAPTPGAQAAPVVTVVDRAGWAQLTAAVTANPKARIAAPRVSVYAGQNANIFIGESISYVKDFNVEVSNAAAIAEPVIGVLQPGLRFDASPVVGPDGVTVSLHASAEFTRVIKPIREFQLTGFPGHPRTIQLPEVHTQRWESADLVLAPTDAGFVVRGLRNVTAEVADPLSAPFVEIWCAVTVKDLGAAVTPWKVVGVIPGENGMIHALAQRPDGVRGSLPDGDKPGVTITRKGAVVGHAVVTTHCDGVDLLKLIDGVVDLDDVVH